MFDISTKTDSLGKNEICPVQNMIREFNIRSKVIYSQQDMKKNKKREVQTVN